MVVIIAAVLLIINLAPVLAARRSRKDVIGKRRILPGAVTALALIAVVCAVKFGSSSSSPP